MQATKTIARAFAVGAMCFAALPGWAQVTIPQEYGKTIKSAEAIGALGPDLFGDQTNFYTGATTFVATDVSLPGNNALPVAVGRRLEVASREPNVASGDGMFSDWDLDIPHLQGVFPAAQGWQVENFSPATGRGDPNKRCSAAGLREAVTATGSFSGVWHGSEYWQGYQMYVPGSGSQELLIANSTTNPHQPTDGKTYRWVTGSQWYVSCLATTANGYPGEGFLALAPDGTRYTFNWVVEREASTIVKEKGTGGGTLAAAALAPVGDKTSLTRSEVWILPTRVEDRFGNSVTYTYDSAKPWRLTSIASSDGRLLSITYNAAGRIATVSAGSRTWSYEYAGGGGSLVAVQRPDASRWTIGFGALRVAYPDQEASGNPTRCTSPTSAPAQTVYTGTITHPSGATGVFRFQSKVHGRSYVDKLCIKPDPNGIANYAKYPSLFDAIGLIEKSISGPGLPAGQTWTYAYGPPNNSWLQDCPNESCVGTKTVDVTGPTDFTRYTFSNRSQHSEGKVLKVEQGASASSLQRTEVTTYLLSPTGQPYPAATGRNPYERGDRTTERLTPIVRRVITQDGRAFTWEVSQNAGVYELDAFGRPTQVLRWSAPSP